MTSPADPYALLDVPRDADAAAIRTAYFRLVRVHTPEDDPEGFREITEAYEVLSDPGLRAEYDVRSEVPESIRRMLAEADALVEAKPLLAVRVAWPIGGDDSHPDHVRFAAATILYRARAVEYAKQILFDLVDRNPTHVAYVCTLVRCLRDEGSIGTARRALEIALEAHPDVSVLHTWLADLDIAAGMADRADRVLEDALERFEHEPFERLEIHFLRALAQGRSGNWTAFAHTAAAIRDVIPADDHDARVHVFSRWIATAHQFAEIDAQRAARVCYDQAHSILPSDGLKEHIDEIDAWIARDDARRAALDDAAVAPWIRGLIVLVHAEEISDAENSALFGPAVDRHLEDREQADAEWAQFASWHAEVSAEIAHVRDEARAWGGRLRPGSLHRLRSSFARRVVVVVLVAGVIGAALGAWTWFARNPDAPVSAREDVSATPPPGNGTTGAPSATDAWLQNFDEGDRKWLESLSAKERELLRQLSKESPVWMERVRNRLTPPILRARRR